MKEKLPPKTGLDFGAMMDDIDREEELKKVISNFDQQIEQMQKTARDLEASCEALIIEAFGMDETTAAIQETAVKIGWTLNLINAQLTTLQNAKVTTQLDDKSVLEVKGLHQDLLAEQKVGLEKYKQELNEAFAQYKGKLKEVVQGHGVWLSERALIIAIVTIEALIFLLGTLAYYYAKAKFT